MKTHDNEIIAGAGYGFGSFLWLLTAFCIVFPVDSSPKSFDWSENVMLFPIGYGMIAICLISSIAITLIMKKRKKGIKWFWLTSIISFAISFIVLAALFVLGIV